MFGIILYSLSAYHTHSTPLSYVDVMLLTFRADVLNIEAILMAKTSGYIFLIESNYEYSYIFWHLIDRFGSRICITQIIGLPHYKYAEFLLFEDYSEHVWSMMGVTTTRDACLIIHEHVDFWLKIVSLDR